MNPKSRILKKSYAMQRMAKAIERAVHTAGGKEGEHASRWVAAWGMLCGIRSETVRLRQAEVRGASASERVRQPSDQIDIPADVALPGMMAASAPSELETPSLRPPLSVDEGGTVAATGIVDRDYR